MARQNTPGANKKKAPAKPRVPRAVALTRASSAQEAVSGEPVTSGEENHPPTSGIIQDPSPDTTAEVLALQGEFSTYCVRHYFTFTFFFLAQLLAARGKLDALQKQVADGPSKVTVCSQIARPANSDKKSLCEAMGLKARDPKFKKFQVSFFILFAKCTVTEAFCRLM